MKLSEIKTTYPILSKVIQMMVTDNCGFLSDDLDVPCGEPCLRGLEDILTPLDGKTVLEMIHTPPEEQWGNWTVYKNDSILEAIAIGEESFVQYIQSICPAAKAAAPLLNYLFERLE